MRSQADILTALLSRHAIEITVLADKHASEIARTQRRQAQERSTALEDMLRVHAEATGAAAVQAKEIEQVQDWLLVEAFSALPPSEQQLFLAGA